MSFFSLLLLFLILCGIYINFMLFLPSFYIEGAVNND